MLCRSVAVWVLALPWLALSGCGSKESVTFSADAEHPTLTIVNAPVGAPLTTEINGEFDLLLSLGDYASDPTSVSLGTVTVQRQSEVLVSGLGPAGSPMFPVKVGVGQTKRVRITLTESAEPERRDVLCDGMLVIAGTVTDSISDNRPTSFATSAFSPDCP